ncbi:hypothetical protein RUM43_013781 [Polyplax serrata]|uniref:Uncharacterized protein n=1 Tax=Polyplax serrata TaxID=468196 RepID=A0AAN8PHA5_POLSC
MREKRLKRTDSDLLDSGLGDSNEIEVPSCCEQQNIFLQRPHRPGISQVIVCGNTIQQHYYPEGGWGWMIVVCGTLVQCLSHGLVLSWGVTQTQTERHFKKVKPTDLGV